MTSPDYEPNTPRPKQSFNDSQDEFLQNFQFLYSAFARNHVPLDAASNAGNHTFIELPEQISQFQTNGGEISLYSRKVSGQTDQLFMRYQGNQQEIQVSNYQIYQLPAIPNVQTTFLTFLPGNVLIYFGFIGTATLDLQPYVTKNLASVSFCPIFISSNPKDISLVFNNNIITQVKLKFDGPVFSNFYIAVANI